MLTSGVSSYVSDNLLVRLIVKKHISFQKMYMPCSADDVCHTLRVGTDRKNICQMFAISGCSREYGNPEHSLSPIFLNDYFIYLKKKKEQWWGWWMEKKMEGDGKKRRVWECEANTDRFDPLVHSPNVWGQTKERSHEFILVSFVVGRGLVFRQCSKACSQETGLEAELLGLNCHSVMKWGHLKWSRNCDAHPFQYFK